MGDSYLYKASLPEHCTPTSPYLLKLSSAFHTCVPTNLALLSTSLGIFSIIAWLFAQLPQIYKNWKLQSAAGLSIFFLLEWLFGDIANLAGALLTGQASWQVSIATYYVFVDVCLSGQYFWYTHIKTWKRRRRLFTESVGRDDPSEDGMMIRQTPANNNLQPISTLHKGDETESPTPEKPISASMAKKVYNGHTISPSLNEKHSSPTSIPSYLSHSASTSLLALSLASSIATASAIPTNSSSTTSHPQISLDLAGRIISWLSTLLYLVSRLPQIFKNYTRRSTSGLSPYMFLAAFLGNTFYSSAILANPLAWSSYGPYGGGGWAPVEGSERARWVQLAAPFWLGAAGVLVLDGAVGVQFLMYGEGKGREVMVVEEGSESGRGGRGGDRRQGRKWEKVTGWVRGWVPSPSPPVEIRKIGGEVEEEEQALLGERRGRVSDGYGGVS